MKAYSKEFRREVLAACDAQRGTREVATAFDVSESWVRRIKQERREQGKTAPATTRRRVAKWQQESPQIQSLLAAQPDITLRELQTKLATRLSRSTLCVALQQLRLTLKKKS